jgi:hypothetical protein
MVMGCMGQQEVLNKKIHIEFISQNWAKVCTALV